MTYEIPQQLEYNEKILFGLTFRQLAFAVIFLPIALFLLFKTNFEIAYRVSFALIPCGIAAVFMFTNIPQKISNWIVWIFNREFKEKRLRKYINIHKVDGGVLWLK